MPVVDIDHVQLAMPPGGEAAARAFYADLLDIPEVLKPVELAGRGGCWFESASLRIHLGVEAADQFRPAKKAHPGLLVDGIDALVSVLESHGYPPTWEPTPPPRHAYVHDPFGNRIELIDAAG